MAAPETSVLIPTYDQPDYLLEALASVFAQTHTDFEVVVVDDGSPPSTAEALEPHRHRIRYVRREERGGPASAKNTGLAGCRGRYVAFLDHDDLWMPDKLEVQVGAMGGAAGAPGAAVSYSRYEITGTTHRPSGPRPHEGEGRSGHLLDHLLQRTLIRTSSCLVVEREALLGAGPFREDLPVADDYEMLLRLARRHEFLYVDRVLAWHRQHAAAASADEAAKDRDMITILREWDGDADLSTAGRRALRHRLGRHLARLGRHEWRDGRRAEALSNVFRGIRLRPGRAVPFLFGLLR